MQVRPVPRLHPLLPPAPVHQPGDSPRQAFLLIAGPTIDLNEGSIFER